MTNASRPVLLLYRRVNCELCDDTQSLLQELFEERVRAGQPIPIVREVDIAEDPRLEQDYGPRIPVLAIDGAELSLATSPRQIRTFLDQHLSRLG